ncbi:MAG: 16S rRNA (cytosine(1402)-N(4))-methyltransferase RsmH [Bacteroidaceae bacterium]|nr:16S rRNA (cytosine(1402)-N(4))-methyltransferase RsmH [Bacteroidaceae bacterium]
MNNVSYHIPVLLRESVDGLNINAGGVYVDATYGGGGHSREILFRLRSISEGDSAEVPAGHLYGFDQDADAEKNALADDYFTFVRGNFRHMRNFMRYYGVEHVDGILADLGVSSHHFDDESRGFSFRFDGRLDMRMNQRSGVSATDVVNDYDETRLADVLYMYGELKNSRQLASRIVAARRDHRIERTDDFVGILRTDDKQTLARIFQALRIEVNHEMDALSEMLRASVRLLRPGGRLSVITYHSLEDRMVKNMMKTGNVEGRAEKDFYGRVSSPFEPVNKKVIVPDDEETARNPRSRSAKLRIAERV